MRRKRRTPRPRTPAPEPIKAGKAKKTLKVAFPLLLAAILALAAYLAFFSGSRTATPGRPPFNQTPKATRKAQSLADLLAMMPEQLAQVDIAEMNLLCATGLPGAEDLDIDRCLARIDEWAGKVKAETERHLYRVHDPRYAEHYRHSEKYFRAEFLLQVLQEDCGVHYNMERVNSISFAQSKDLFIHGVVADPNGGTCVSMPVLYVAVGRRLG